MKEVDNVVSLYREPSPVEIEIDVTPEELDEIRDEINSAPNGSRMQFVFNLNDGERVVSISAEIEIKR
jgi:flagellar capping protein FliD